MEVSFTDSQNNPFGCDYLYDTPAITSRTVSFDGTHVALTQNFTYSTTWNSPNAGPSGWSSKQTTVTTTDQIRGGTFQTIYTYVPFYVARNDPNGYPFPGPAVPLEKTTTYKDWNGAILKTVTKTWQDQFLLTDETVQLGTGSTAPTSDTHYTYYPAAQGFQLQEKDEYDFGPGAKGSLLRKTVQNYAGFPATPIFPASPSILDRPCQIVVNGGNGSRVAETDYFYDNGSTTTPCGAPGTPSVAGVAYLTGEDDTNYNSTAPRGNVTTATHKCFPSCADAVTTYAYDEGGQVVSTTDSNANTTQYSYADNYTAGTGTPSGSTDAYLTKITRPAVNGVSHVQSFSYAYSDGQLTTATDENGQPTKYFYNDSLRRLTETDYPDGGQTTLSYNDSAPSPTVTTSRKMNTSGQSISSLGVMDGLGHVVQTQLTTDPDGTGFTDTTYDGLGRVFKQSNPHRSAASSTDGTTTYAYDALGRTTQVTDPDSSTVLTTSTGRAAQVQDEGNGTQRVIRVSQTDGLGRLVSVCEATTTALIGSAGTPASCAQDIPATGFLTTYQYDALDNLLQVNQAGLGARKLTYDSLSRLTSATNPESGTICYGTYTAGICQGNGYDANSNLITKTAPAPNQTGTATVTTTYAYDALNRLLAKSYSDGSTPSVSFLYDVTPGAPRQNAVGRLVETIVNSSSTAHCPLTLFDYDPMGRIVQHTFYPPSDCSFGNIRFNYSYDLLGNKTSEADDLQNTISYGYSSAARLTTVSYSPPSANIPATLMSAVHYNALGQGTSDTLGDGEVESFTFANRGWLQSSSATVLSTNIYSLSLSHAPNGNVTAANDSVNGNWTYGYDPFNRLTCANLSNGTCAAPTNGHSTYNYLYDRFGNRWQQNGPQSFIATFTGNNPTNPANNNRMDGFSYDAAGNLLNDGVHSYTYDAENRIINVDGGSTATYVYDGEGHSIQKTITATSNQYETPGTWYFLYDLEGRFYAELNPGTFSRGDVYAGNRHLTTIFQGNAYFDHQDQVGTDRARTWVTGTQIYNYTTTSLPFGDALAQSPSPNAIETPVNFTGQRRDPESGLDDFTARYYGSSLGRFVSPDPDNDSGFENQDDPQSWDAYSYVRNNPLNLTDPDGKVFCRTVTGSKEGEGVTQICDVTNSDYVKDPKEYDAQGYTHYDCSCDTDRDKGNYKIYLLAKSERGAPDISTDILQLYGLASGVKGLFSLGRLAVGGIADLFAGGAEAAGELAPGTVFNAGKGLLQGEAELSSHAAEQAVFKGLTKEEIAEALSHVPKQEAGRGSVLRFRGQAAEVRVNRVTGTIVTVIRFLSPGAPSPLH
ncbi:MAG: RHS repeat-associated core domain-containing protein [Candidatus Acidiferrales bacterium]